MEKTAIEPRDITEDELDIVSQTYVQWILNFKNKQKLSEEIIVRNLDIAIQLVERKGLLERDIHRLAFDVSRECQAMQQRVSRRVLAQIIHNDPDVTWVKGKRVC